MRSSLALLTLGLGLVSACGDDGTNHLADAAPGDAHKLVDGAPALEDARVLPVSLAVTLDGSAAAGVTVYFLNADSSVVANTTTDATGVASAVMAAGGSVTAIEPPQEESARAGRRVGAFTNGGLDTFAGVKPGDQLHLDLGEGPVTEVQTASVTVTVPALDNATDYELVTSCGDEASLNGQEALRTRVHAPARKHSPHVANPPVTVSLRNCSALIDMIVTATGADPDTGVTSLLGTIFEPQQALSDGGSLTIVDPYVTPVTQPISFTHVPTDVQAFQIDESLVGVSGFLFDGSTSIALFDGSDDPLPATGTITQFPAAASTPAPAAVQVLRIEEQNPPTVFNAAQVVTWGAPADAHAIDLSTLALANYTTIPAFDTTAQRITWTPETTGVAPDFVFGSMFVNRANPDESSSSFFWQISAPGAETGAIQFPTLPTDVFDFTVTATDNVNLDEVETAKVPGGYDTVRANVFDFDTEAGALAGTTGAVAITDAQLGGLRLQRLRAQTPRATWPRPRAHAMTRAHVMPRVPTMPRR